MNNIEPLLKIIDNSEELSEDLNVKESIKNAVIRLSEKYVFIGAGRNRAVFLMKSGKYVIKVPVNYSGMSDNSYELRQKNETKKPVDNEMFFPAVKSVVLNDLLCIVMEKIEHITEEKYKEQNNKPFPCWVGFIDCNQVGLNKKGILMPYDYA